MSHTQYNNSGKDEVLPLFSEKSALGYTPVCYDVPGLMVLHDYVDSDFAEYIVEHVDSEDDAKWRNDLKRRVQHFGYLYDYRARRIGPGMRLGDIPDWAYSLGKQLVAEGLFDRIPDQVIVNEYTPGQGIAPHVDAVACFGDVVASLSLLAPCTMSLRSKSHPRPIDVDLPANSLLVISGPARHEWSHAIAPRTSDRIMGRRRHRERRLSATFRTVLL